MADLITSKGAQLMKRLIAAIRRQRAKFALTQEQADQIRFPCC